MIVRARRLEVLTPNQYQYLMRQYSKNGWRGKEPDDTPFALNENIFQAFREIRDLTKGDGLGLPTCKQMALKMKGDLVIDPEYTKGTRFVLELHG